MHKNVFQPKYGTKDISVAKSSTLEGISAIFHQFIALLLIELVRKIIIFIGSLMS